MNNPALVNALLYGNKHLTAQTQNAQGERDKEFEIAFKEIKSEDGWAAAILMNGKPITRPYRKITLDFEILNGFYDLLCLLAAFIDPGRNIVFIVKDCEGTAIESYLVYYEENKEKRRCVEHLE